MDGYLLSKDLFQTIQPGMPQLTLGGYLLRQHRLLALQGSLLKADEQTQLVQAVAQFEQVKASRASYFAQKGEREYKSRLRQWREYLRDLAEGSSRGSDYAIRVEVRTMLEYLPSPANTDLAALDAQLRQRWQPGSFVWSADWQAAYPADRYWWLYGGIRPTLR
jgi:hypothetical protein